jgi:hypothetical protein
LFSSPLSVASRSLSIFHLWNLDAPTIAVLWQILFARCFHIPLSAAAMIALGVSVWVIYATDRLLDVTSQPSLWLTKRHAFHRRYCRQMFGMVVAAIGALACVTAYLRPVVIESGLLLVGIVVLYFLGVHLLRESAQRWFPKEVLVGILFAAGSCLAPWCRAGRPGMLILPAFLFAALCCLNCVAIEVWEWRSYAPSQRRPPPAATLWLAHHLRSSLWLIASAAGFLLIFSDSRPLFAAILVSAGAFLCIDSLRRRLPIDLLRMMADMPLLSPLLLLLCGAARISFR